jgi:predicted dehydrogenase
MPIKIIHIGVGGRGRWPVERIAERDDYESVALVDLNEESLAKAREVSGLGKEASFSSISAALEAVEADAAVLITPPDMHAAQGLEVICAGKHLLVEKPFTKDLKQAQQIVAAADERGLKIAVCQNKRFSQTRYTIHRLVKEGALGKPSFGLLTQFGWRPGTHHSGQDTHAYLWERGIHDLDAIAFMMGSVPIRVWAHDFNPAWSPYKAGGGIHGFIEFENGVTFGLLCTFAAHTRGSSLRIEFEEGSISEAGVELELTRPGSGETETLALAKVGPFETILLDGFADFINEGTEPSFSGRNNLNTVAMVEAMGVSSLKGEVINIAAFMAK